MIQLNRYDIHKALLLLAIGLAVLTAVVYIFLQDVPKEFLRIIFVGGLALTASMFIFYILTKIRRTPHPKEVEKTARDLAAELLEEIAQADVVGGHGARRGAPAGNPAQVPARPKAKDVLTDQSVSVVRITELIKHCSHSKSHTWADRLETLYTMVPAYLLPETYGEADGPLLDWHKYDLCIIAPREMVDFAKKIERGLIQLRPNRRWRIYVDTAGGVPGVEQEEFIKSVFFGGSWKCLALVSAHDDERNRRERNWAMRRAQRLDSHTYRNYLIPIGVDRRGLEDMARDPYLNKYAENLPNDLTRKEQKEQLDEIIKLLLSRLEGTLYPGPPDPAPRPPAPEPSAPARRFAVALSFPGEHRHFVKTVADELKQRLVGEEIFYDEDYVYELARPDMDTYLQAIYLEESELVAVFLCAEYAHKQWCGLEWRAVREIIKKKESDRLIPIRFGDTHISGLFSIDGYLDAEKAEPAELADIIVRRLHLLRLRYGHREPPDTGADDE